MTLILDRDNGVSVFRRFCHPGPLLSLCKCHWIYLKRLKMCIASSDYLFSARACDSCDFHYYQSNDSSTATTDGLKRNKKY